MFVSANPSTGETLCEVPEIPGSELIEVIEKINEAQQSWGRLTPSQRVDPIQRLAAQLRTECDSLARTITLEMGKPIQQSRAEVEKCAWVCDYYAEHAPSFLEPTSLEANEGQQAYVSTEPLGVVLAIMPWNFPFWQLFRAAIPAIAAGNGILLKHAPSTLQCAQVIEKLFHEAGFPPDLLRNVAVNAETLADAYEHRAVQGVTLTGSTAAGRKVAANTGAQLKKTVLELGGSDPYLILEDADLSSAAEACVSSRMINNGQSCIAAKRFIVVGHAERQENFVNEVVERMRAYPMKDPLDSDSKLGPMARPDLRDLLHQQVQSSIESGARLLLGGEIPDRNGNWYPATVLTEVKPGMAAFDEELFGPVAAIIGARDEEEGVRLANRSHYGLGGAVFTSDIEHAQDVASRLNVGSVAINDFVKSDPRQPFGGILDSGFGRELGRDGIYEFTNRKTVVFPGN